MASVALLIGFVEARFLDPWHKASLNTAAKLQEEFDCHVLRMAWNRFLVGRKVDPEDVIKETSKKLDPPEEEQFKNWYPQAVSQLPLHLARLVCQRTNLRYDGELRKRYRSFLIFGMGIVGLAGILASIALNLSFASVVLAVLVPVAPLGLWVTRELNRQAETVQLLDKLKAEVETFWGMARDGAPEPEIGLCSRELQDAIYNHRVTSPLIFDWVYGLLRKRLEEQMNRGAEHWVSELISSRQG